MMDLIIYSIPVFFALLLIEVAWDYFSRKKQEKVYRLNDAVTNISCGIADQVSGIFAKLFTIGAYILVFERSDSLRVWEWTSSWPAWIACFLAVDMAYYWAHRLSHEVNLLWTGHVVHHQSEEYNLSVALRQGAFQKLLTFWVYLPLALFGFPPVWFVTAMALNLLYQFWIHTEAVGKMGPLELVLNTPSHHRVHHGRNPKYIDKNHAGVFIIWDRLFGTFQQEEEHPHYGITHPSNTFNAVEAHIQPFQRLFREVRGIPSFKDKVLFLFKPPGWYPESLGGFRPAPEISENDKKFDVSLPASFHWYALFQFSGILGFTTFFLFSIGNLSLPNQIILAMLILYYLASIGSIFNRTKNAIWMESLRLAISTIASVFAGPAWFIPTAIYCFLSAIWWIVINRKPLTP